METFEKIILSLVFAIYLAGFMVKNIITVKRTGKSIKGKSLKVNLLIGVTAILYILTYLCIFSTYNYLLKIEVLFYPYIRLIGYIFILFAFILGISTLITMKNSWRVGIRPEQKTELIVSGFFKFSRNPYFLSYYLLFLGFFLIIPTVVYLLFYISFVTIIHLMILDEEKHLTGQHRSAYQNYQNRVNRYLTFRIKN